MHKKSVYYFLLPVCLISIDQITKLIFSSRDFFVSELHIHLLKNYGLAFSLNFGQWPNLILIALGLSFFIYYFHQHQQELSLLKQLAFVLIFAGAVSNILDRAFLGYVRDFLDFGLGFTFNLADAYVAVGLISFLIMSTSKKMTKALDE